MDEKTLQALTALANKLGTTAEYLWGVLLKQAPLSGVVDLIVFAAWACALLFWSRFVQRKTTTPIRTEENRYPEADWSDEMGCGLAWASVVVAWGVFALVVGCCLSMTAASFLNPGYWALKQIIH